MAMETRSSTRVNPGVRRVREGIIRRLPKTRRKRLLPDEKKKPGVLSTAGRTPGFPFSDQFVWPPGGWAVPAFVPSSPWGSWEPNSPSS
jgi:hypothetical protein